MEPTAIVTPYRPTPREGAILLMLLIEEKEDESGKELIRLRISELTLKRLWARPRLSEDFLREVEDWLFTAGWALFNAGNTFAIVSTSAVESWPRVSSKRLHQAIIEVTNGRFDFTKHQHLLLVDAIADQEDH